MKQMKETFELLMFKDGHQVAQEDITNWRENQIEDLLIIQERLGRTWKYRKSYVFEEEER